MRHQRQRKVSHAKRVHALLNVKRSKDWCGWRNSSESHKSRKKNLRKNLRKIIQQSWHKSFDVKRFKTFRFPFIFHHPNEFHLSNEIRSYLGKIMSRLSPPSHNSSNRTNNNSVQHHLNQPKSQPVHKRRKKISFFSLETLCDIRGWTLAMSLEWRQNENWLSWFRRRRLFGWLWKCQATHLFNSL